MHIHIPWRYRSYFGTLFLDGGQEEPGRLLLLPCTKVTHCCRAELGREHPAPRIKEMLLLLYKSREENIVSCRSRPCPIAGHHHRTAAGSKSFTHPRQTPSKKPSAVRNSRPPGDAAEQVKLLNESLIAKLLGLKLFPCQLQLEKWGHYLCWVSVNPSM